MFELRRLCEIGVGTIPGSFVGNSGPVTAAIPLLHSQEPKPQVLGPTFNIESIQRIYKVLS